MKDIPIIFSAPMVRALLEGRKTMTRRPAWREVKKSAPRDFMDADGKCWVRSPWQKVKPGDRLWVRENWRVPGDCSTELSSTSTCVGPEDLEFAADFSGMDFDMRRWRPSIHLPRWGSRLALVVASAKTEFLHELTEGDARAEGVEGLDHYCTARSTFMDLWDKLHGPGAWASNPNVVALTFTVHQQNIDAMKSAA